MIGIDSARGGALAKLLEAIASQPALASALPLLLVLVEFHLTLAGLRDSVAANTAELHQIRLVLEALRR